MRSNHKKIGLYVQQANKRNKDILVTNLRGININKEFMPSVANTNGVDLSKYKIVSKYQFSFNPMHVGRDEMLPISMLSSDEPVIVSPAYTVFEVKDHEELDPEYLMMWCSRSEFDRNAWFTTDSSVRGGFSWADFCEMELPVLSIEKQREIVQEYNTIKNRIQLNENMNQSLEEYAHTIYKHWFVDFEFPISAEYAASIGKPELEGKPYKSSGGEMIFCEELEKDIPKVLRWGALEEIAGKIFSGGTPSTLEEKYWGDEYFWLSSGETGDKVIIDSERMITQAGVDNSSTKLAKSGDIVIATAGQGKTRGQAAVCKVDAYINQSVICIRPKKSIYQSYIFVNLSTRYYELRNESDAQSIRGSLNKDNLSNFPLLIPSDDLLEMYEKLAGNLLEKFYLNRKLEKDLKNMQNIVLSKMSLSFNSKEKIAA